MRLREAECCTCGPKAVLGERRLGIWSCRRCGRLIAPADAEIVRGGVQSIPLGQWESAESLAFSRRQILWQIILPQALKRMIPPWMNLYAILTMATTLISVVGIQDGMTLTRGALVAEGRLDLYLPMYLMLLLMFFIYCYPIALWTAALERRYAVKD